MRDSPVEFVLRIAITTNQCGFIMDRPPGYEKNE